MLASSVPALISDGGESGDVTTIEGDEVGGLLALPSGVASC